MRVNGVGHGANCSGSRECPLNVLKTAHCSFCGPLTLCLHSTKMNTMKILIVLFGILFAQPSFAGLQGGLDAYNKNDYATALKELQPLAGNGNAKAENYLGLIFLNQGCAAREHGSADQFRGNVRAGRKLLTGHSMVYHGCETKRYKCQGSSGKYIFTASNKSGKTQAGVF